MKRIFVFIRKMSDFSPSDFVYKVKVGSSQREQVKVTAIEEYCKDCGLYFHPQSDLTDLAIESLRRSVFPNTPFWRSSLRMVLISVDQLYRLIIDDDFDLFESSVIVSSSFFFQKRNIDPIFYFEEKRQSRKAVTAIRKRKYLKSKVADDFDSFAAGTIIVILVFLVAGFIEGHFGY